MTQDQPDPSTPYPSGGPGPAWSPYGPRPDSAGQPVLTDNDRTWAAVAHVGSFVAAWIALGFLCPVAVLIAKGNQSPYVRHHAYESLNFQLNALLWGVIGFLLIFVVVGLVVLPLIGIWYVIFVIIATVAANRGEWYRYPAIIRFFKP